MQTMKQLVNCEGIRARADLVDSNPNAPDWQDADHWKVVLRNRQNRQLTIYFSMGMGLGGKEPTAAEVLDCLASDASGIENARSFEDWASEYGYDTDSRKAERIYKVSERQTAKLAQFMGDAYNALLWETERE